MMLGLGQTAGSGSTTSTVSAGQSFLTGVQQWASPSAALTTATTLLSNPAAAFAGSALPFTLGVLAVPAALVLLIASMSGGGGRQ
jgi:hypothetical protein